MRRAMWDFRKLSLRVALDLIAVDVDRDLTWEWPERNWPGRMFRLTGGTAHIDINDDLAYIPARFLP